MFSLVAKDISKCVADIATFVKTVRANRLNRNNFKVHCADCTQNYQYSGHVYYIDTIHE